MAVESLRGSRSLPSWAGSSEHSPPRHPTHFETLVSCVNIISARFGIESKLFDLSELSEPKEKCGRYT
jgi:hypothetical protein